MSNISSIAVDIFHVSVGISTTLIWQHSQITKRSMHPPPKFFQTVDIVQNIIGKRPQQTVIYTTHAYHTAFHTRIEALLETVPTIFRI